MAPEPGDPSPQIFLLGRFEVRAGGHIVIDSTWTRRKAKALLKLLALQKDHSLHREQALDALWPELDPAAAANNLHKSLHHLRTAFRERGIAAPLVRAIADRLILAAEVQVDVDCFCTQAQIAHAEGKDPQLYEQALALYAGEILPEDRYEDWAERRREQLQVLHIQLLGEVSQLYEGTGQTELAAERLRQLLECDPLNEEALRSLMRLHALAGNRHRAIRQYQICCEALQRELGVEPSPATEALYQQIVDGRAAPETRQARSPAVRPEVYSNVPAALTSFIGRAWELAEVSRMLATTRLLTLTGAGGSGKTRLALEVGNALMREGRGRIGSPQEDERGPTPTQSSVLSPQSSFGPQFFPDGVWLTELAALSDPRLVVQAVAEALGVREEPGQDASTALAAQLRSKRLLLILDNCEHLISACAVLVERILRACPGVTILATSREALAVAGEVAWRVPSLSLPSVAQAARFQELSEAESVRLFVERAHTAQPAFRLTEQNAGAIVQVCRQLDGMPLALELAAARLAVVTVQQLASRLDGRFRLLAGGSRTALPRQQTLRATFDWSYDLLTQPEQSLFRRFSVFAGSFSLEAAEAIGSWNQGTEDTTEEPEDPQQITALTPSPKPSVLDHIERLVGKSLLLAVEDDDEIHYRFLATVRQYASERLAASAEAEEVAHSHAEYYLGLAETAARSAFGSNQAAWLQRLEREHANLRAALSWLARGDEIDRGLRLATALRDFWDLRGYLSEGRAWLGQFLALDGARVQTAIHGRALHAAAFLAASQGDIAACHALSDESLAIFRELGEPSGTAESLYFLALANRHRGDYATARALSEEGLRIERELGDSHGVAIALRNLGKVASRQHDWATARLLYDESLVLEQRLQNSISIAVLLSDLAEVAIAEGDIVAARGLYEQSLRIEVTLASSRYIPTCLEGLARVDAAEGRAKRAAHLFGAAAALRETLEAPLPVAECLDYDHALAELRAMLGQAAFVTAWSAGWAMPPAQATGYALNESSALAAATPPL